MSKKYIYISFTLLALLFIYFYSINRMEPLFADDFAYSFIFGTNIKVTNLFDIFNSLHIHYFTWGGRLVAHFFGQTFLLLGKPIFNIFNAIMFTSLIVLIIYFVRLRKMDRFNDIQALFVVLILCWFGLPNFGETSIWLIGSVNYLWTTVFILLFLLPYRYLIIQKLLLKDTYLNCIGIALIGFLAGMTNENTGSINCMLVVIFYLYLRWFKFVKLPKWFYTGSIGVFLGFIVMIIAPGNQKRSEAINYHAPLFQRLQDYYHNLEAVLIDQKYLLFILFILFIGNILLFIFKSSNFKKDNFYMGILFTFSGFMTFFIMIASPIFPVRASYGGAVFLVISCLFLIENLNYTSKIFKVNSIIIFIFTIAMLISMKDTFKGYIQLNQENLNRISIVNENKNKNDYDIILPLFTDGDRYVFVRDIEDPQFAYYFKKYYGLNNVIAEDEVVLNTLESKNILNKTSSILKQKNFGFYKSIVMYDIKLIKQGDKSYLLFLLNNKLNINDTSDLRFFINAFPLNSDTSLLQEDRKRFGYDNWDIAPTISNINDKLFFVREIQGDLSKYENIEMGFYSITDGRKGNVLSLNKNDLSGYIEPVDNPKIAGIPMLKKSFEFNDAILLNELKLDQFTSEQIRIITKFNNIKNSQSLRLFIHAYPIDSEIENLPNNRIQYGYANWDFSLINNNKSEYLTNISENKITKFKKIDIGLYNEKGNIGKVITLYDIDLVK